MLISFSGGIDSTTLVTTAIKNGITPQLVSFSYGSKHNRYENEAAANIASYFNLPLHFIDLSQIMVDFKSNLLKTGGEIPEGHYEDSNMAKTVVPGRNMIFLSILAGLAESLGIKRIGIGVHQGDHAIYPDCRPSFIKAMQIAINLATDGKVDDLTAPFLHMDKTDIVNIGLALGVPYRLTRTCYKDQEKACGKCGSCVERLEAFALNNATDPIEYA